MRNVSEGGMLRGGVKSWQWRWSDPPQDLDLDSS